MLRKQRAAERLNEQTASPIGLRMLHARQSHVQGTADKLNKQKSLELEKPNLRQEVNSQKTPLEQSAANVGNSNGYLSAKENSLSH